MNFAAKLQIKIGLTKHQSDFLIKEDTAALLFIDCLTSVRHSVSVFIRARVQQ